MLALRPRHALVLDNEGDSSKTTTSSLKLYLNSNSSKDKEHYYLYNKSLDNSSKSETKSLALPPPIAQTAPNASLKEHLMAARAQVVTLKYLTYLVY
jgi:hypothetical protein